MSYCKFKHVNRISPTENVLQMEIKKLKEEMAVMTEWVNSIKDWMENEIEEVNTELEEVGDTVESLETEGFMVLNTLDEAFASMIILKDQMRTIYYF